MITALVAGERDPGVLAQPARTRMRAKISLLEETFGVADGGTASGQDGDFDAVPTVAAAVAALPPDEAGGVAWGGVHLVSSATCVISSRERSWSSAATRRRFIASLYRRRSGPFSRQLPLWNWSMWTTFAADRSGKGQNGERVAEASAGTDGVGHHLDGNGRLGGAGCQVLELGAHDVGTADVAAQDGLVEDELQHEWSGSGSGVGADTRGALPCGGSWTGW